jgi:MoxR-like ATPase
MTNTTASTQQLARQRAEMYIPDPALIIAAEVALELGLPLLLAGEPGTGKTSFANYLAHILAPRWFQERANGMVGMPSGALPLYKFETKSTSVATDLFYRFDSLRLFHAAHAGGEKPDNRDYLTFEALGKAILYSRPWNDLCETVTRPTGYPEVGRAVVLIDEVDKAPRDFPNDILNEIERMFFRIPELQTKDRREVLQIEADPDLKPLIVLTSNSERTLPDAFLRRCIFHHIDFPKRTQARRLQEIIEANLGQAVGTLANSALNFFFTVREADLDKPPTTAELVQWVKMLQARRWGNGQLKPENAKLADVPLDELQASLGVLAKTKDDLRKVQDLAAAVRKPARG